MGISWNFIEIICQGIMILITLLISFIRMLQLKCKRMHMMNDEMKQMSISTLGVSAYSFQWLTIEWFPSRNILDWAIPIPLWIGGAVNPSNMESLSNSETVVLVAFVALESVGRISNELVLPVSANSWTAADATSPIRNNW